MSLKTCYMTPPTGLMGSLRIQTSLQPRQWKGSLEEASTSDRLLKVYRLMAVIRCVFIQNLSFIFKENISKRGRQSELSRHLLVEVKWLLSHLQSPKNHVEHTLGRVGRPVGKPLSTRGLDSQTYTGHVHGKQHHLNTSTQAICVRNL